MNKIILFLLLLFAGFARGQLVNIPDANFKTYLLSSNATTGIAKNAADQFIAIDSNADGEIQQSEADAVAVLYIYSIPVTNLTGVESFSNLQLLDIFNLTTLSAPLVISTLSQLRSLKIEGTNITSVDLTGLNSINYVRLAGNTSLTNLTTTGAGDTLTSLICYSNKLQSLDVSNFTLLTMLLADTNELTSLNVQGCTALGRIDCYQNKLTNVDFSGLPNLQIARIMGDPILYDQLVTSINLSGCTVLTQLEFFIINPLTTLNLEGCAALIGLGIANSNLTSLNVNGCTSLQTIDISNSGFLQTLDLSTCTSINMVNVSQTNITSLLVKNGRNETITFLNNSNLEYICADDSQLATIQQQVLTTPPTITVNSYCSFEPGGNFNTIIGQAAFDTLADGCDLSDVSYPNIKFTINENSGSTFTNNSGNYTFYTQAGNFTLTPDVENLSYFIFSPPNAVINFPVANQSIQTQNFCVSSNGVHPDLEVTFVSLGNARPGFNANYKIVFKNKGNRTLSGNIKLNYNTNKLDFVSTLPEDNFELNPDNIIWNYTSLKPFETRSIDLTLNVITPPTVNNGDVLDFTATINPVPADETPLDNVSNYHQTVINSYDPNEIECLEGHTIAPEDVGNYLHYNINFENIGTADAVNIVVKDTINTAKYNMNSLRLQYASHDVETKVTGNVVEFIFKNIHLQPSNGNPIGGHGNVLFKIKTVPNLEVGDEILGSANIFFDYNAPVATNEERTVIAYLSNDQFLKDETVSIVPNPTQNNITVASKNNIRSILLFDAQGRLLQTVLENSKSKTLDISYHSNGIYFLKVITELGSSVSKIVKE